MSQILDWMKGIVLLFFIMAALLYFVPKDAYKKYIRFFMEMILMLALLLPVLELFYKGDTFEKMIHYDEFWQQMDNMKMDMEHVAYLQGNYYVSECENSIEEELKDMVKTYGYEAKEAAVVVNDDFGIERVSLNLMRQQEGGEIVVGEISVGKKAGEPDEENYRNMKQEIMDFYQLPEEKLDITVQ